MCQVQGRANSVPQSVTKTKGSTNFIKIKGNEHIIGLISYEFTFLKWYMDRACYKVVWCLEQCQGVWESVNACQGVLGSSKET